MLIPSPALRRPIRRSVAAVLIGSLALSLVPPPATAAGVVRVFNPLQSATIGVISTGARGKITDDQIDRPGSAIPHTDFDIVDPLTKKRVDRTTLITVPSGQKVKAGDYYDGLNAVETDLNKHGQTLKGGATSFELGTLTGGHDADLKATVKRAPQTAGRFVTASGSDREHETIVQSAVNPALDVPDTVTKTAPTAPQPTGGHDPELIKLVPYEPYGFKDLGWAPIAPPPTPPVPGKVVLSRTYSETEGDKGLAAVALDTSATAEGGPGNVGHVVLAESLSAYLFGAGGNIISASADANPKGGTVDMSAIGDSIVSYNGPSSANPSGKKNIDIFNVSVPISVSIFTVTLAASANAVINAGGYLWAKDSYILATIDPYMSLNGSFSASFGIGDTSGSFGFGIAVGVEGDLTIASINMPLAARAGMPMTMLRSGTRQTDKNIFACYLTFDAFVDSEADYSFLSGSISIFLKACFIFCGTIFKLHLANWSGITGKDTFFNQNTRAYASLQYSDLAEYGVFEPGTAYSKDNDRGLPASCDALRAGQHDNGAFSS